MYSDSEVQKLKVFGFGEISTSANYAIVRLKGLVGWFHFVRQMPWFRYYHVTAVCMTYLRFSTTFLDQELTFRTGKVGFAHTVTMSENIVWKLQFTTISTSTTAPRYSTQFCKKLKVMINPIYNLTLKSRKRSCGLLLDLKALREKRLRPTYPINKTDLCVHPSHWKQKVSRT